MLRDSARRLGLCLVLGALVAWLPASAGALASLDFSLQSGQFSVTGGVIDFGNDLQISFAQDDGNTVDGSLENYVVAIDDIVLSGAPVETSPGVFNVGIDTSSPYSMSIFDLSGFEVLSADFDPGEFITIGSNGLISPEVEASLMNITLMNGGDTSAALSDLAAASAVDFNMALSAAGQDFATRLGDGRRIAGSVAGSVAAIENQVPEPATLGLLLVGLAAGAARRRRHSA